MAPSIVAGKPVSVQSPATARLPARPVFAFGRRCSCWAVAAKVWFGRSCVVTASGPAATTTQAVELGSLARGSHLGGVRLRVDRGIVVLDDLDSGTLWDVDADPVRIDDWASASPQVQGS